LKDFRSSQGSGRGIRTGLSGLYLSFISQKGFIAALAAPVNGKNGASRKQNNFV